MFLHAWSEGGLDKMARDFELKPSDLEGVEVLLASYTRENYEGDAFVLFRKDGKLYEVNGYHCSCYGLEGQWEPEETTIEELRHRLKRGTFGRSYWYNNNVFADELAALLDKLEGS